jgi:hypothetical protein
MLTEGAGSSAFAITVVVAAIAAYDATGVRQHAGRQASVINAIVTSLPPEVCRKRAVYRGACAALGGGSAGWAGCGPPRASVINMFACNSYRVPH